MKENDSQALISVTVVSSLVLNINLIIIYIATNYFGLIPVVTNKFHMVLFMLIVGCLNHYFFVRKKKFLNYEFQKDRSGGILIVAFITFTFILVFILAQYNRERIFKAGVKSNEPRKESLEGKIRRWFE